MSQIYKPLTSSGPIPPIIATSYVTDVNSPAIPAANVLDVFGGQTTEYNSNGIQTDGSSGGNVLTVQLTNTVLGTVTTTDATPTTISTFNLGALPAVYTIEGPITAIDITTTPIVFSFGAYQAGVFSTNGTTATEIGGESTFRQNDAILDAAGVTFTASGNNILVQVEGVAGRTINWEVLYTYRKVN